MKKAADRLKYEWLAGLLAWAAQPWMLKHLPADSYWVVILLLFSAMFLMPLSRCAVSADMAAKNGTGVGHRNGHDLLYELGRRSHPMADLSSGRRGGSGPKWHVKDVERSGRAGAIDGPDFSRCRRRMVCGAPGQLDALGV